MSVDELISELMQMPKDLRVCFFVDGEQRVDIVEVRNVGDVVDLYEDETQWKKEREDGKDICG